jgi:hypothetical protein
MPRQSHSPWFGHWYGEQWNGSRQNGVSRFCERKKRPPGMKDRYTFKLLIKQSRAADKGWSCRLVNRLETDNLCVVTKYYNCQVVQRVFYPKKLVLSGGLMVSVFVIGPNVRGFKALRGRKVFRGELFLRAIKHHITTFFRVEVKLSAHVVRLYGKLQNLSMYERDQIHHFLGQLLLLCYLMTLILGLPESSGGQIGSFLLSISFHHG